MPYAADYARFVLNPENIPIAFDYGGVPHCGMAEGFGRAKLTKHAFCDHVEYTYSAVHLESGALFTVYLNHWEERNACSWRAEILAKNRTKVFGRLCWKLEIHAPNATLSGNKGDCTETGSLGYAPYSVSLSSGAVHTESTSGRPTHSVFPYYRLGSDAGGLILILSWQGCWYTDFSQEGDKVLFSGGQAGLQTYLEPDETLRMPLMLALDYTDDPINTWRRFYIDCLMPRPGGQLIPPTLSVFSGVCSGLDTELIKNAKRWYDSNGIDYDFWWFDAGWGADGASDSNDSGDWIYAANIEPNRKAFPDGMAWLGRQLKKERRQLMLWFELEVIRTPKEKLPQFYARYPDFQPEWILGESGKEWNGIQLYWNLLDLGNPQLLAWLERRLFAVMDEAGATIFRIDFNIDPGEIWRKQDTEGRAGITENKYCAGYLKLLGDIRRRYGSLMDSCASGGGRNDLETMMYMVPLHYTDYLDIAPLDSSGQVYMRQNLWCWFPYVHNMLYRAQQVSDLYQMRAQYSPCITCAIPQEERDKTPIPLLKERIAEWRSISNLYYGDYYQLLPPSFNETDAKAFAFFDPATGRGFVQVLLPSGCSRDVTLNLKGIADHLEVRDLDGKEVIQKGHKITIPAAPGTARLILIKG